MAQRQKEFNDSYKDWIALQDDHFVKTAFGAKAWRRRWSGIMLLRKPVCSRKHHVGDLSAAMDAVINGF